MGGVTVAGAASMRRLPVLFVLAVLVPLPGAVPAQTLDPHAMFEDRCARCHGGHAGDLARESLILSPEGKPTGRRTGKPVEEFLVRHAGGFSPQEIAALTDMFAMQLRSAGVYKRKCRACHDNAKQLARRELVLRDGRLVGRYSARNISDFLGRHGRLSPAEIETVHTMLLWQLRTAAD
jgi:cytochrome c5